MPKMLILYYSRTGNTKKMADAVAVGAKMVQGVEVELNYYITPEALGNYDAILIGIPTYHHDMTVDMKNLFEEAAVKNVNLKGKTGAASGSYGWSGEAPRMIIEITKSKFEMNATEPPLLVKYAPDQAGLKKCRELERKVAERLIHAT
jgi:flavorubredoxin